MNFCILVHGSLGQIKMALDLYNDNISDYDDDAVINSSSSDNNE